MNERGVILAVTGMIAFVLGVLLGIFTSAVFKTGGNPAQTGLLFVIALYVGMLVAWAFDKTA